MARLVRAFFFERKLAGTMRQIFLRESPDSTTIASEYSIAIA